MDKDSTTRFSEESAWDELIKAAETGNASAQTELGVRFDFGERGAQKDAKRAAQLYKQAAAQGTASAMVHLGVLHEVGDGVVKDMKQVAELYEKAAGQGHAFACTVQPRYAVPEGCWGRQGHEACSGAVREGSSARQHNCTGHARAGLRGVAKDLEKAIIWFRQASAKGIDVATSALERLGD